MEVISDMKKKKKTRFKVRFFMAFLVFGSIMIALGYNLFCNIMSINKMNIEKRNLKDKIAELENEKEVLETDIQKLEDPEYIAKYVREKYYYSRDGEVILRIDE